MENNKVYTEVIAFLTDTDSYWGEVFSEYNLCPETSIEDDLHCFGDDALELILAFSERFDVDISYFDFSKYFSPEGLPSLTQLIINLFTKKPKRYSFTIQNLVDAVVKKKLE